MAWISRDQYNIIEVLGRGGFGRVILARKKANQQLFAIKEVNPGDIQRKMLKFTDDERKVRKIVNMAKSEGQMMTALKHNFIVTVYGWFTEKVDGEDVYHMVMEYSSEGDLEKIIRRHRSTKTFIDEGRIALWIGQLCDAVRFLHENGVAHRDIKSDNVFMFDGGNVAKLGDFGVAKDFNLDHSTVFTAIGTIAYCSPQWFDGKKEESGLPNDVWALGILTYRIATREFPFNGNLYEEAKRRPLPKLPAQYSSAMAQFLDAVLAVEVKNRPTMQQATMLNFLNRRQTPPSRDESAASEISDNVAAGNPAPLIRIRGTKYMPELFKAAKDGDIIAIRRLVNNEGADIESRDVENNGNTALIWASCYGHADVVKLLVELGAEVDATNKNGYTALMSAAENGNCDVVKLLVELGANVSAEDSCNQTALLFTSNKGHVDVAKFLIELGAEVDARDIYGRTALMHAALNGHVVLVKWLAKLGGDINAKDNGGFTPLICAAGKGHVGVVDLLSELGADLNSRNDGGWTAAIFAAWENRVDVLRLLFRRGADLNIRDNRGQTALDNATAGLQGRAIDFLKACDPKYRF